MIAPECLKDALALALTQGEECTIRPAEDGWHIALKSTDTVSLCDLLVKAEAFDGYEAGEAFAFRTKSLIDALARTSPAEISVGERIEVRGRDMTVRLAKYAENATFKAPQLEMDSSAIVPADRLRQLTAGADSDRTVMLQTTAEGLLAEVSDEQGLGVSLMLPAEKLTLLSGEARAHYPLFHMVPLLKALPRDAQLCMEFSSDYPLRMSCVFDGWTATMMVAPRIIDE